MLCFCLLMSCILSRLRTCLLRTRLSREMTNCKVNMKVVYTVCVVVRFCVRRVGEGGGRREYV